MRILMILGWLLLIVAGCDSHVVPPAVPKVQAPQQGQDKLFDTQRQALDKARQVEETVQRDAEAQRQALERESK